MNQPRSSQQGMFLIEAMVALLIFALGILGLVAMGATAVSTQSDAQYRTEASAFTDAIASEIALNVNRTSDLLMKTSLNAYQHQPNGVSADCVFAGNPMGAGTVLTLVDRAANFPAGQVGLPGATQANQQILVDTTANGFNRVEITLCWRTANDSKLRRHTLVTYINRAG